MEKKELEKIALEALAIAKAEAEGENVRSLAKAVRGLGLSAEDLLLFTAALLGKLTWLEGQYPELAAAQWAQIGSDQGRIAGTVLNLERAADFATAVGRHVNKRLAENPKLTAKQLTAEIASVIQMDSNRPSEAQEFPRKNKHGAPYSEEYILAKVRELLQTWESGTDKA